MQVYTRLILERIMQFFLLTFVCVFVIMMSVFGFDHIMGMPEAIPLRLLSWMMLYEWVHILCWVLPVTSYVALVLWAAQATESQLLYRLFHAGWSRVALYRVIFYFLLPWWVLSCALNIHYLPYARTQQRWLLEEAYEMDATLHLEGGRFHRFVLAGDVWMVFFDHSAQKSLYAFNSHQNEISVVASGDVSTDVDRRQLLLRQGERIHWDSKSQWPLSIWNYDTYGLGLPGLRLTKDTDPSNYARDVWSQPEADYRLEAYNRVGRVLMMLVLSWVPLLLVDGTEQRRKVHVLQSGLLWYVWYWILFVSCRSVLALDHYRHLAWILLPHGVMGLSLYLYYYRKVRQ